VTDQMLRELLDLVQAGQLSPDEALDRLRWQPVEEVGDFARIDHHRALRQGMPEFVYAEGKSPEQTAEILAAMVERHGMALASRVAATQFPAIQARLPHAIYDPVARLVTVGCMPEADSGQALVIAAGTSDLPVAEEAAGVLRFLGNPTQTLYDVGVAGIHRLLAHLPTLTAADVLIVVAGMEGALPTVVGGLVSAPVIAVPTSVGYGASFGGVAALLSMLNSCATGLTVVNIDNGLGAASAAHRLLARLRSAISVERLPR
jgi:pyridinium-3,5-biscarboxylic acid mononucleotide synthase